MVSKAGRIASLEMMRDFNNRPHKALKTAGMLANEGHSCKTCRYFKEQIRRSCTLKVKPVKAYNICKDHKVLES